MRRACLLASSIALLVASIAGAEPLATEGRISPSAQPEVQGETAIELGALGGAATSPFYVPQFPEVSGQVLLLHIGAARRIARSVSLGAVVPLALTSVRQPAGSYVDEGVWGNPALTVDFQSDRPNESGLGWLAAIRARLSVPTGGRRGAARLSQMSNRALALADALQGMREPALYTPGVASLTVDYRLDFALRRWRLGPRIALPFLIRVDDAELPPSQTGSVGWRPRLDVHAAYFPEPWFGLAAEASLTFDAIRVTEPIRVDDARRRFQPSLRPAVIFESNPFRFFLSCLVSFGGFVRESFGCGADGVVWF